jgi:hypothetical protein
VLGRDRDGCNLMAAAAAEAYKEGVQRAAPAGVCPCAGFISECEEDRNAGCRDLADLGL